MPDTSRGPRRLRPWATVPAPTTAATVVALLLTGVRHASSQVNIGNIQGTVNQAYYTGDYVYSVANDAVTGAASLASMPTSWSTAADGTPTYSVAATTGQDQAATNYDKVVSLANYLYQTGLPAAGDWAQSAANKYVVIGTVGQQVGACAVSLVNKAPTYVSSSSVNSATTSGIPSAAATDAGSLVNPVNPATTSTFTTTGTATSPAAAAAAKAAESVVSSASTGAKPSSGAAATGATGATGAGASDIWNTWSSAVSTTPSGQAAVDTINAKTASLSPTAANSVKNTVAMYDTWLKTGGAGTASYSRLLQTDLSGGAGGGVADSSGAVASGVGAAIESAVTDGSNAAAAATGAVSPSIGSTMGGVDTVTSAVASAASGASPTAASATTPVTATTAGGSTSAASTAQTLNDMYSVLGPRMTDECRRAYTTLDSVVTTGALPADSAGGASSSPVNKIKCDTWSQGRQSFQLCRQVAVSNNSVALVSGSVTNTGTAFLCNLTVLIGNFDQSQSYYPQWLPNYPGTFKPGDVLTFGATVPIQADDVVPSADIDAGLMDCTPATTSQAPTPSPTTTDPSSSTPRPTPILTTAPRSYVSAKGIDWGHFNGDTRCLGPCLPLINNMEVCTALDTIFTSKCSTCDQATLASTRDHCLIIQCSDAQCHAPTIASTSSGHSLRSSLSILLGLFSVILLLQIT